MTFSVLLTASIALSGHAFTMSPSLSSRTNVIDIVGASSSLSRTNQQKQQGQRPHSQLNMFTGIIEEMGQVLSLETKDNMTLWDGSKGSGTEMTVKGGVVMDGAYLGCSISVNGVCLTATELDFDNNIFKVGLAPETLRKTNLGSYGPSSEMTTVNLERASEIGGRNSGHFVQGHVDDVGTIVDQWIDENSLFFKISFPSEFMRYIVPKGFIAIDGTSLTVCDVTSEGEGGENWFTFMLVEYTQKKIILPSKKIGDTVNVEVDVLGKYSERAWEAVVPKMEALESKVIELETRLRELEGGNVGAPSSGSGSGESVDSVAAIAGDIIVAPPTSTAPIDNKSDEEKPTTYGDDIPKSPGRLNNDEGLDMVTKSSNVVRETKWVRTKQTFIDTNY